MCVFFWFGGDPALSGAVRVTRLVLCASQEWVVFFVCVLGGAICCNLYTAQLQHYISLSLSLVAVVDASETWVVLGFLL